MSRTMRVFQFVALGSLFLLLMVGIRPLQAADAVVGTGTAASCTEAAFDNALATVQSSMGGTITFDCAGAAIIIFTGGKIITNSSLIIDGGSQIILSGGNVVRHFYVENNAALTIKNITLQNGFDNTFGGGSILSLGTLTMENAAVLNSNVDSGHSGGAIMGYGQVTIRDSLIENNTGGSVGGLFLVGENADATIYRSTFRNNRTTNNDYGLGGAITTWDGADVFLANTTLEENEAISGGAIYNSFANTVITIEQQSVLSQNNAAYGGAVFNSAGSIIINNSVLQNNIAFRNGGAIQNENNGTLTVANTTFDGNTANNSFATGGGIQNSGGDVTLANVTLSRNASNYNGGGIANHAGTFTLINSTLSNNSTVGNGGGLSNYGTLAISNVTFSGNTTVNGSGGAIFHNANQTNETLTLKNVIFNHGSSGLNCVIGSFSQTLITSTGFNISSDYSCNLNQVGDMVNTDPRLAPLRDNRGITRTHLPLADSPVIDAGQCISGLSTDQRHLPRLQGSSCDMGAVERQPDDGDGFFVYLPVVIK